MHRTVDDLGDWTEGSNFFYIASNLLTFVLPFILLFIPWWALLVQVKCNHIRGQFAPCT